MKLAQFSVRNSLLINVLSLFILVAGFYSMMKMRREAFPQVNYDIVTINTIYSGAPTEDVEKLVTLPLEEEIRGISGIDKINSTSEEGISSIGIILDPSVKNKIKVVNDIQRAVDQVRNLPEGAEDPVVFELDTRELPILEISLSGDVSESERRLYAESLEDKILEIDGVASVNRIGWRDKEFWVEADPDKLKQNHVSIQEIMDALRTRNRTIPGGQLTTPTAEFNIRTTGEFTTSEEIEDVIIRANDAGNWLKVKDVAHVKDTFEDETRIAKVRGERATAMVVVKRELADAISLVREVHLTIDAFKQKLPEGMDVTITNDLSYYIKRRLSVLKNNGIIGIILVLLILFIFLDPIPAVATALGLPIAFFLTFIVMSIMGVSINLVTMLGLIIVLGMLVDDGIIVSENVYRYVESGMSPREAALRGTSEVMIPVTVTILTTFAAFSPLLFMTDIIGKFIRYIPIVVMVALAASLFEAFVILPAHLSDFVRVKAKNASGKVKSEKKWLKGLVNFYTKTLNVALRFRYLVLLWLVLCLAMAMWIVKNKMQIVMFAGEGIEYFYVRAESQKGTPLETLNKLIAPVEDLIATLDDHELDSFRTYLGSIEQEGGFDPNVKRGSHLGQLTVFLTPLQKRKRTPQEIIDALRPGLEKIKGFEKLYFFLPKEGPPTGNPVEVAVKGEDFGVLQKIADRFVKYLEPVEGVSDVNTSYDFGKKQLRVVVDEAKAKRYFLTVGKIAAAVRNTFRGGVATTIKPTKAEEEINVLVRFPKALREDLKAFDKILIPNQFDNLVPLSSVAQIEESEGVYKITHLDGKRVIYVTAQVDNKKATSLGVNLQLQKEFQDIGQQYLGYTVKYSGEFEDQQKSIKNLQTSFLFALAAIFIILVAMFRSLIQPFIVMMAIPFGVVGVIFAFYAHGRPLSFFAFMGLVGLTGIVVNDSIVLVDFINRLRIQGKERRDSLIEAGQIRLRPVIMTTVTTIGGLVSVAYGIGGGDPFLKPMALAIVWGLLFATGITLIAIPCIYAILDDITTLFFHRSMVKKNSWQKD